VWNAVYTPLRDLEQANSAPAWLAALIRCLRMDDPFFEATISAVRGFDLGDDAEMLDALANRQSELSADEHLLRSVLYTRASQDGPALEDLDRAAALGHPTALSQVHYLRARLLSRVGRTAASGEALDAAERASQSDRRVSEAELAHARALSEWEAGRPDDALVLVTHGLSLDDASADRWRGKGALCIELARHDDAVVALDHALALQSDDDEAMVLHAIADAANGNPDEAARWIERALHLSPHRREALAGEPRLASVRQHPSVSRQLEPSPPPDTTWMDSLTSWTAALRYAMGRPEHRTRHAVQWFDEAEARRIHAQMVTDHERGPLGTMHSAATLEYARELLEPRVIIGHAAGTSNREGAKERCIIAMDPGPHGELWVALSELYPSFLWIPAGRDAASLCAVLDVYFPRPTRRRADLTSQARGFIGYRERIVVPSPRTGCLEPAGEVEIDRHFTLNPFVESAGWGSAFADDPWPDDIPSQPRVVLKIERRREKLAEQAPGSVWSMSRRLRHSRGYLAIERHHGDIFTAMVRYSPSPHPGPVAAMNARFGTEYPQDLPVDALGALLGFQFDHATDLEAKLDATDDPEIAAGLLLVISALRHSDLDAQQLYRTWSTHDAASVRATICTIATEYNYESLLETMSAAEPDAQLRAEIEAVLDEGLPMPDLLPSEVVRVPSQEEGDA